MICSISIHTKQSSHTLETISNTNTVISNTNTNIVISNTEIKWHGSWGLRWIQYLKTKFLFKNIQQNINILCHTVPVSIQFHKKLIKKKSLRIIKLHWFESHML